MLLDLADGRNRRAMQPMNSLCLAQIETMLADPTRKRCTLVDLLRQCHTTGMSHPCPIIKAPVEPATAGWRKTAFS